MRIYYVSRRRLIAYVYVFGGRAVLTSNGSKGWDVCRYRSAEVLGSFSTLETALAFAKRLLSKPVSKK